MPISHQHKDVTIDLRDERSRRKRLVTELSTKPFVIPEDEYGMLRVPLHPALHSLTPEIVPGPPESKLRSALRSSNWRLLGWSVVATGMAAGIALITVDILPVNHTKRLTAAFPAIQDGLNSVTAAPSAPPSLEAATKIAEDFERLGLSQTPHSETDQDSDATLNRLMEWDRNTQATPPR